jgi:hypothetical protein
MMDSAPTVAELSVAPSPVLGGKIDALRRKHTAVAAATGVAEALAAGIVLLAAGMVLDWLLDLPVGVRAVLLLGDLAVLSFLVWTRVSVPVIYRPDEDSAALMVERAHPALGSRLIASIQLTRPRAMPPGTSGALVRALVHETETLSAPIDFGRIVRMDRLVRAGVPAGVLLAAGLLVYLGTRPDSTDLLKRVLLSSTPVPRRTRVECISQDQVIALGDTVKLEAVARGIIPATGTVQLSFSSGREQEFPIDPVPGDTARFVRVLENVQDSFHYIFYLNDGRSRKHLVRAVPRPAVAFLECTQAYPPYTQLGSVRRAPGDLMLLAGSRLRVRVTANKEIRGGQARLTGTVQDPLPLQVDAQKPREALVEIPIPAAGLTGFSIHLLDRDGLESRNPAVYRIDIVPDRLPAIRVTYPDRKEELVTSLARMIVGFEASDDYAIGKVFLRYRIDKVADNAEKAEELDLKGESPRTLRRRFVWELAKVQPPEGSTIEYWLEVRDNNDVTGPGISTSDHYLAKIVSEAEKRADLMSRLSEYLGTLTDVATEQEKLSDNLGELIQERK